jgi:hypothetical protein
MLQKAKPNRKSQSALEYMMTYGWAILIIVIVAGVLYSLGVFSPSNSASTTITGFSGLGSVSATCLTDNALEIGIGDLTGATINITRINATTQNGFRSITNFTSAIIQQNQLINLVLPNICSGGGNALSIIIQYTEPGQLLSGPYFSSGTISTSAMAPSFNPSYYFNIFGRQSSYTPPYANSSFAINFTALTLSAWVYNNGSGIYWQNIVEVFNSTYPSFLDIGVIGPGSSVVIRWATSGPIQPLGSNIPVSTWAMVTGTWDGATNNLTIYLNGRQVGSATGNGAALSAIKALNIGGGYGGMSTFAGKLSDIQVYNTALSPAQVNTLYNEGFDGVPFSNANLVGWWPLDGTGQDYSGNGHNVKLYGATFSR